MHAGINQKIAPIRFLLLIQPDDKEKFARAMELAWSLWGGVYSPIFAYYQELPNDYRREFRVGIPTIDYYKNTIENYDPDLILFDEDITEVAIKPLAGEREVKTIEQYLTELASDCHNQAISLVEVTDYLWENEFKFVRSDDLVLSLPQIAPGNLLLKALIGSLPAFLLKKIMELYAENDAFEQPVIDWKAMEKYRGDPILGVLELNNYKLNKWSTKPYKRGTAIYFMRSDRLQDIINFWNLRAAGWQVVSLAVDMIEETYFKNVVGRFTLWFKKDQNGDGGFIRNLVGYNLTNDDLNAAWAIVRPDDIGMNNGKFFSWQSWFPRFWASYKYQDADHIKSEIPFYDFFFDHYNIIDDRIEFKAQQLPLEGKNNHSRESAYKIILEISLHDEYAEHAELLTGITNSQLRLITTPFDFRKWRLSRSGIHRTINYGDDRIMLSLPKALDFFKFYFANKGHRLEETANSKLAREVLKNIGGLRVGRSFLRVGPLRIIELFEGGKEISYMQLVAEIKKTMGIKKVRDTQFFINRLLEHKIVEMGASIQCAVCDQHGFFLPSSINENITCPICRNQFTLPMADPSAIKWVYRGIGPFTRANKADGVMAVFATLSLFQSQFADAKGKLSALFGFELNKSNAKDQSTKEVDLCLLIQNSRDEYKRPDLIFCECKTYKRFTENDIERMKLLGEGFPDAVLTFATLNEKLDEQEIHYISDLVKYFQRGRASRPINPILILTGTELLREDYFDGLNAYKSKIKPYHKYNDYLGALCEFSITEHLHISNWWHVQEFERQRRLFVRQSINNIILSLLAYKQ